MKLYTEEQVIALTRSAFVEGQNHNSFIFDKEFKKITPIQLPSDEEITDKALEVGYTNNLFTLGAKWMRDKIQGGNND